MTCKSSFFSVYIPDFKKVFFLRIPPAPSEVNEVNLAALRLQMQKCCLRASFEKFCNKLALVFDSGQFYTYNLSDLERGSANFFKNHIFEILRSNREVLMSNLGFIVSKKK